MKSFTTLVSSILILLFLTLVIANPYTDDTEPMPDFDLNETLLNNLTFETWLNETIIFPEALITNTITIGCDRTMELMSNNMTIEQKIIIIDKWISGSYFIECLG